MNFKKTLDNHNLRLTRQSLTMLQVNIGKRCNQSCSHCHVESSPTRTENMDKKTIDQLLTLLKNTPEIQTVDITGGAPELNPHFKYFVSEIRKMNRLVIDRCNLTVLFEPDQKDTAAFLAEQKVEVVASLPCYLEDNVDKQRGKGVFEKSLEGLKLLNSLGYGVSGSDLILNLVYNPVGPHLPPDQARLEIDYKKNLHDNFGIQFNHLFTITNMPIKRYETFLRRLNKWDDYTQLLQTNFNPAIAGNVMCCSLVSVGWDGKLYDCDFNQMLDMPMQPSSKSIWDIETFNDCSKQIAIADHCFACTAGAGSSCGGALND
jgi:radical SAM/Cys-rich protein